MKCRLLTFNYGFHHLSNWKPSNPAAQVEHEQHCNCTIVSAEKGLVFPLFSFVQKFLRENPNWVLDRKHFDSFFKLGRAHSFCKCEEHHIHNKNLDALTRLGAMLLLYEHYNIAGLLATRPNASRKMMFVSFWSVSFVTGRAREGTIPRFVAFNIFEPKTHLCASI